MFDRLIKLPPVDTCDCRMRIIGNRHLSQSMRSSLNMFSISVNAPMSARCSRRVKLLIVDGKGKKARLNHNSPKVSGLAALPSHLTHSYRAIRMPILHIVAFKSKDDATDEHMEQLFVDLRLDVRMPHLVKEWVRWLSSLAYSCSLSSSG